MTSKASGSDSDQIRRRFDVTTRALRGLGAAMLLASASTFLVQRWDQGNDLLRFGFLLTHSIVLLGAAYFCGGRLGESRSARLFLWTSLAMVPVHFGVLGGLVYSVFALDTPSDLLPSYAVWKASSPLSAIFAFVATLSVVVPTSLVAARVLVRKQARRAAFGLVGLSSLLLVPVRGADWVGIAALVGAISVLYIERRHFTGDYTMRTWEGRLVRALLWVPIALVTSRTVIYYPTTDVFLGLLILAAGICATVFARGIPEKGAALAVTEWLGSLTVAAGTMVTLGGLGVFDDSSMLWMLASSVAILVCSYVSRSAKDGLERVAALFAFGVCTLCMILEGGIVDGALSIVVGAIGLSSAILMGRLVIGGASALVTLGGICTVFERAVGFDSLANWGTLSALGLLVVVGAAYVERHKDEVMAWMSARTKARRADATDDGDQPRPPTRPPQVVAAVASPLL